MIDRYLSNDEIRDLFYSSMCARTIEKRASEPTMEKDSQAQAAAGYGIGKIIENLYKGTKETVVDYGKLIPAAAVASLLVGGGVGGVYNALKDRITEAGEDDSKADDKLRNIYASSTKEIEDRKWYKRVRDLRDSLKRDSKNLTPEQYAARYQELSDALDERKETV